MLKKSIVPHVRFDNMPGFLRSSHIYVHVQVHTNGRWPEANQPELKSFFLGIAGLGCTTDRPLTQLAMDPVINKVNYIKGMVGKNKHDSHIIHIHTYTQM